MGSRTLKLHLAPLRSYGMVTGRDKGNRHEATPYVWDKMGQNGMAASVGGLWKKGRRGMVFVGLEKVSSLKDAKDLDERKEKKNNRPLLSICRSS